MELKPRDLFRTPSPGQNCHFFPDDSTQWSTSSSCHTAESTAPHSPPSFLLHRSIGQVFHGNNVPVLALGKATAGGLCCRATFRASPQEWVPTTRSWNWEHQSHQLLWCSGQMQCWKQLIEKHSHVEAKLEYYTNLNTQQFGFGLLWNSMKTQILGAHAWFHQMLPFKCLWPQ